MPAPTRSVSKAERETLKEWVKAGGTLVMTVGWDRYLSNRDLLADFKFYEEKIPLAAKIISELQAECAKAGAAFYLAGFKGDKKRLQSLSGPETKLLLADIDTSKWPAALERHWRPAGHRMIAEELANPVWIQT